MVVTTVPIAAQTASFLLVSETISSIQPIKKPALVAQWIQVNGRLECRWITDVC